MKPPIVFLIRNSSVYKECETLIRQTFILDGCYYVSKTKMKKQETDKQANVPCTFTFCTFNF